MYAVILAGGGGTRLWPLSKPECPKPFLRLLGEQTLIQQTVTRLAPLVEPQDVYVVVDRRHLALVAEQLPQIPLANVIGEPVGRNTAAAVALAAEIIDRPEGEVMLVLPADAHIADEAGFRAALAAAGAVAEGGSLVTLGVRPDGPETGYGYVLSRPPARYLMDHQVYAVERFVEKPNRDRATELIATGLASWNAGIFAWTRATIRARLARHAADILDPVRALAAGAPEDLVAGYPSIRSTSIDYAVMEPASVEGAVEVVPMSVGWSDLGSWAALRDVWLAESEPPPAGATIGLGNRRDIGSFETLVLAGDRLVVTIGLAGVVVVDTPDALLICAADRSQDVKVIAEEQARTGRPAAVEENKP